MINVEAALLYLALGSLSKLVTMKYPTPGERVGQIAEVIAGAGVAGFFIPPGDSAAYFVTLPFAAAIVGKFLSDMTDWARLKYDNTRGK